MAEGNSDRDLPFLQYLVPEIVPGLPRRGHPCPSPDGEVSYFNGSPPSLRYSLGSDSNDSLISLASESSALLPSIPYGVLSEPTSRLNQGYGAINNETDNVDHFVPSRSPRLWCQVLKSGCFTILFTTFLFYAIGHAYKMYMQWDLTRLMDMMDVYKSYIIVSYIVIIFVLMFGLCLYFVFQKNNRAESTLNRSWSRSLLQEVVYM